MTNAAGVFENASTAEAAYNRLRGAGFKAENISLAVSPQGRDRVFTGVTTTHQGAHDALQGSIVGAAGVGALSALVGGLIALVIGPGGLAAGPLAIALSSAAGGAVVGGLSGALVEAGFSHDEAGEYTNALEAGKAVLVVHDVPADKAVTARSILRSEGATTQSAA